MNIDWEEVDWLTCKQSRCEVNIPHPVITTHLPVIICSNITRHTCKRKQSKRLTFCRLFQPIKLDTDGLQWLPEVRAYRTTAAELMEPWRWTLNMPKRAITKIPVANAKNWLPTPAIIKKNLCINSLVKFSCRILK